MVWLLQGGGVAGMEPGAVSDGADFAARLRVLIGDRTREACARRWGLRGSLVQKYLDGAEPGITKAAAIAEAEGVSLDWLIRGRAEPAAAPRALARTLGEDPAGATVEPGRLVKRPIAAADALAAVHDHPLRDVVALRADYALRILGGEGRGVAATPEALMALQLFEVVGDAMAPTLRDGDFTLVDVAGFDLEPLGGGVRELARPIADALVYVVDWGIARRPPSIHRLYWRRDGGLRVTQDAPDTADVEVEPAELGDLRVLGRVIWRCGPP